MAMPGQSMVFPQSSGPRRGMILNTGISLDPDQLRQDDIHPESNQGTPCLTLIDVRIQQLQSRHFLLLKMQHFRKKAEDNSGRNTEEMAGEDSNQHELEAIQRELEELLLKKEELEKIGTSSKLSQQNLCPTSYITEIPSGGIYLLPPPPLDTGELQSKEQREDIKPAEAGPTDLIFPVDRLCETAAVTQCPFCQEIVLTEVRRKVGKSMWMLCCLCSMLGCVAGCCVIPFFRDHLRDVDHQCSHCQAHIRSYQPF